MAASVFGLASWNGIYKHATGQATIGQAIGDYVVNAALFVAFAPLGGGTFIENVAWGAGEGAIGGGANAAIYGEDVGKGMIQGAAFGGGLAGLQSGYEIISNGLKYDLWNTNIVAFDKLVKNSVYNANGEDVVVGSEAQKALNFYTDRFGGPQLTYSEERYGWSTTGFYRNIESPSTSLNGTIKIPTHKFLLGADYVKRSSLHEIGHYIHNIPWANQPGGTLNGNNWINISRAYGNDGIYGYSNAIENAGRLHINYNVIAKATDTFWGSRPWEDFNFLKWYYLIPKRF